MRWLAYLSSGRDSPLSTFELLSTLNSPLSTNRAPCRTRFLLATSEVVNISLFFDFILINPIKTCQIPCKTKIFCTFLLIYLHIPNFFRTFAAQIIVCAHAPTRTPSHCVRYAHTRKRTTLQNTNQTWANIST